MQATGAGLAAVGAERRLAIWFARYVIALVALVLFVTGDLLFTVLLIALSEFLFLSLRPRPKFDASTYRPPAPDQWQTPITVLRWGSLINSVWTIVTAALVLTIVAVIVIVIAVVIGWRRGLGAGNFAVVVLLGVWLLTRPFWIAPLRRALKMEATRQLAPHMATLHVGADGVEFDMRPAFIRRAPESYRFWVGFTELNEVRMMDGLTAQAYWGTMAQYDPTIVYRMEWELLR
ncbi:MAG TPA: hypothetical protein VF383_14265, partial [Candidatus Dormibacteraeota bacterium]